MAMFSSATVLQTFGVPARVDEVRCQSTAHAPIGAQELVSVGHVPPREAGGAMVEAVNGRQVVGILVQTKKVNSKQVAKLLAEKVKACEVATGRKPGRAAKRELKEQAIQELLPSTFPVDRIVPVLLDAGTGRVVVGATGAVLDHALTFIVRAHNLGLIPIQTVTSPTTAMVAWLRGEGFDEPNVPGLGRSLELEAPDGTGARVRYVKHSLEAEEIKVQLDQGKLPTQIGITLKDASCVLTDQFQLKRIEVESSTAIGANKADAFDADLAIETEGISALVDGLIQSMGGLLPTHP